MAPIPYNHLGLRALPLPGGRSIFIQIMNVSKISGARVEDEEKRFDEVIGRDTLIYGYVLWSPYQPASKKGKVLREAACH